MLDETGYLTVPLADIADEHRRAAAPMVERALAIVQELDPPASARATSPNASRCRPRRPTATIRRWRG